MECRVGGLESETRVLGGRLAVRARLPGLEVDAFDTPALFPRK